MHARRQAYWELNSPQVGNLRRKQESVRQRRGKANRRSRHFHNEDPANKKGAMAAKKYTCSKGKRESSKKGNVEWTGTGAFVPKRDLEGRSAFHGKKRGREEHGQPRTVFNVR